MTPDDCLDLVSFDELAAECGEDAALRLARHTQHAAPDGSPLGERARLGELLELQQREMGGEQ